MSLKRFLGSRTFFIHLLLALVISLGAVFVVLNSLKLYTRHGESFEVPNLYGQTEDEFRPVLLKSHLRYVITDSSYVEEAIPGGVIDQVPDAGHRVKRNRTLFLTINAIAPEQVAIPRLTDISLRQSLAQLESAGLLPGEITYKPSEFKNLVLNVTLNGREVMPGETVPRGTRIDLIIGSGQEMELVVLPDLKGFSLETVRQMLAENMLSLGVIIYDNTVISRYDSLNARIWRQQPDPASIQYINMGSSVDVWVTLDENRFTGDAVDEFQNL